MSARKPDQTDPTSLEPSRRDVLALGGATLGASFFAPATAPTLADHMRREAVKFEDELRRA